MVLKEEVMGELLASVLSIFDTPHTYGHGDRASLNILHTLGFFLLQSCELRDRVPTSTTPYANGASERAFSYSETPLRLVFIKELWTGI